MVCLAGLSGNLGWQLGQRKSSGMEGCKRNQVMTVARVLRLNPKDNVLVARADLRQRERIAWLGQICTLNAGVDWKRMEKVPELIDTDGGLVISGHPTIQ
jgi:hypothetical protein